MAGTPLHGREALARIKRQSGFILPALNTEESMSWKPSVVAALLVALSAALAPAVAVPERGPIRIAYERPEDKTHQPIYRTLRDGRALERIRDRLADWRLPRTITIRTKGCDGEISAWYDPSHTTVTICYEYIAYIQDLAHTIGPAAAAEGVTPENFVVGPLLDVMLHELAHAVFDLKKIPILGREEDAADQVAAYVLLEYGGRDTRRTIASIGSIHAGQVTQAPPELKDFAGEHGLPAQRFFNLMCLSYGKDPKAFGDLVPKGFLTEERAQLCEHEYRQVSFAVQHLIMPTLKGPRRRVATGDR
jgi:hypothetical protein